MSDEPNIIDETPNDESETPSHTRAQIEAGRLLFAREVTFMLSVVKLQSLPSAHLPEVCFAGRSNVGKSSLINALTNRKGLARASNTPGRTSKADIARWTELTRAFLRGRAPLRRVFVLIDSRHGLKDSDRDIMAMLDEAAVTYQLVLTKTDKLKKGELEKVARKTQRAVKKRPAAHPALILTSSVKKNGLDELRAEIAMIAETG